MIVPSRPIPFDGMMFRVSTAVNGGDGGYEGERARSGEKRLTAEKGVPADRRRWIRDEMLDAWRRRRSFFAVAGLLATKDKCWRPKAVRGNRGGRLRNTRTAAKLGIGGQPRRAERARVPRGLARIEAAATNGSGLPFAPSSPIPVRRTPHLAREEGTPYDPDLGLLPSSPVRVYSWFIPGGGGQNAAAPSAARVRRAGAAAAGGDCVVREVRARRPCSSDRFPRFRRCSCRLPDRPGSS